MEIDSFVFSANDYTVIKELGRGNLNIVYLVERDCTNEQYAAKILQNSFDSNKSDEKNFLREVLILSKVRHPCIIGFYGFSLQPNFSVPVNMLQSIPENPAIILEVAPGGSIGCMIRSVREGKPDSRWNNTTKQICILGTAYGMMVLHSKNIIHRDLKSDNVLLSSELYPKIADFGLSKNDVGMQSTYGIGTPLYMAPEIYKSNDFTNSVDVYAFGIMLYEILTGLNPYPHIKKKTEALLLGDKLDKGLRPKIPDGFNEDWAKLMKDCWSGNANDRPTFQQVVQQLLEQDLVLPEVDMSLYKKYIELLQTYSEFQGIDADFINTALKNRDPAKIRAIADKLYDGRDGFPRCFSEALNFYHRASIVEAEKAKQEEVIDDATLMSKLSPEVLDAIRNASAAGDPQKIVAVGDSFSNGSGVFPRCFQLAARFYRLACDLTRSEAVHSNAIRKEKPKSMIVQKH